MTFSFVIKICFLCLSVSALPFETFSQKLAILSAEKSVLTQTFGYRIHDSLSSKLVVLDSSMSETAFRSVSVENALNMTAAEARGVAAVIGCDYFLMVKTGSLRRSSFEKAEYYEAFSVLYLVSGRTGRLVFWDLRSLQANSTAEAKKLLLESAENVSINIAGRMTDAFKFEMAERPAASIEAVPADSTKDKTFRPPMPYKRIKPEYTRSAYLYDAKGTVDISADIDGNGMVIRTEIVRWAGYGLDEAVNEAVRKMNWRPAERGGKALPMRVLLRYNFTKIEKE